MRWDRWPVDEQQVLNALSVWTCCAIEVASNMHIHTTAQRYWDIETTPAQDVFCLFHHSLPEGPSDPPPLCFAHISSGIPIYCIVKIADLRAHNTLHPWHIVSLYDTYFLGAAPPYNGTYFTHNSPLPFEKVFKIKETLIVVKGW